MSNTDNIVLDHIVELFLPTQCGVCREPLPEDIRDTFFKDMEGRFSDAFGGFSVTRIQGGWKMPDGTLAVEPVDVLSAMTTKQGLEQHGEDVRLWAVEVADRLSQDRVALRIDKRMALFPRSNPKAPCAHKTAGKVTATATAMQAAVESAAPPRDIDRLYAIQSILSRFGSLSDARALFCGTLGYTYADSQLPAAKWPDALRQVLRGQPQVVADTNGFRIVYLRLAADRLLRGPERAVINRILRDDPSFHGLFVVSDGTQKQWRLVNSKQEAKDSTRFLLRRLLVGGGGGVRTATERLSLIDLEDRSNLTAPAIQELHDQAFDVEAVTRQFFLEIANWYFWARDLWKAGEVRLPAAISTEAEASLFLIRLLTRLIFCWFLREKRNPQTAEGLIPDSLFDPHGVRQLLKDTAPDACTYYPAILQNLFFATLNTEMDVPGEKPNRRFVDEGDGQRSDDHMVHTFWRHHNLLRDPDALVRLLRGVPFFNGGLFECLDDRVQKGNSAFTTEIRIDGFSNDRVKQPKLPNFLFFGPDQTANLSVPYDDSSRSDERVRPLISILQRYNFTLTENTPLEQEVALDPELLGHVFENLLAAYNPETGMVARKATGSFYTPRVVVDWMVDQALLVYLSNALARGNKPATEAETDRRLQRLLSWEDTGHDFRPQEIEALIDAIDHLKALDPACGSGAFPMGLLQKLVHVLRKLDPDNKGWRRRQEKALNTFESAPARDEARLAIERAFARDNDDYGRKLYLIENCLYGVDIQPIACQIAKLRFFISLIVDQHIEPRQPNYGILPLPNLETKIVAADTLLGLQRGQLLLGSDTVRRLEKQLQQVRHDYFTARRYKDKKTLRARDKELSKQLAAALTESGECSPYDASRLAEWNPYDTNKDAPFFDPAWMFGLAIPSTRDKGVFDLVIGNPPYVRQEQLKNVTATGSNGKPRPLKDTLKDLYECYTGTADLYVYFFERALQLLRVGGVLSFITSNKYMRAAYGERLRTYLFYATHPHVILDFGDADLFTSVAYPCIFVTQKIRQVEKGGLPDAAQFNLPDRVKQLLDVPDRKLRVHTWQPGAALTDFPEVFANQANDLVQRDLKPEGWRLESPANLRLLERLDKAGRPLGDYVNGRLYYGLKTGLNEAFVVDGTTRTRLIAEHPSSKDVLKKFLRGRDVKRWRCEPQDLWLVYVPWHFPLHEDTSITGASSKAEREFAKRYPAIYEHLRSFKSDLSKRNVAETGVRYEWYALQRWGSDYWREFEQPKVVVPAIEDEVNYAPDLTGFYGNDKTSIFVPPSVPFALAITNSAISWWITRQRFASKQGGFFEFKPMYISKLPVPPSPPPHLALCERLSEALIWLHGPGAKKAEKDSPGLMIAYFEQWLSDLVYELFFPEELHARRLKLFDETAKLNPPDLATLPETGKLTALLDLFDKAYDSNAPLRGSLFDLRSLEVVRIIEEASNPPPTPVTAEAE